MANKTYDQEFLKESTIAQLLEEKKQLKIINQSVEIGEFGNVMIVQDKEQQLYALKIISNNGVDDLCEQKKKKSEDEAVILGNCDHPNIVKYYESFQIGFNYFILMEKCEISLQQFIDQKYEHNRDLFIRFALQMISAIGYLHSKDLVLRGLSPNQVLFDNQNNIKLFDFGLAHQVFLSHSNTQNCCCLPPEELQNEQIKNNVCQTREGDIWAYGICLYLLAGATKQHVIEFTKGIEEFKYQDSIDNDISTFIKDILKHDYYNRPSVDQIIQNLQSLQIKDSTIQSIESIQKAKQTSPPDESSLYYLGNSFFNKNMFEDAVKCYNMVIQLNPLNEIAYNNLGSAYLKNNMREEAIICYQKAIELNPNYDGAFYNLGQAFFQNQKQKAIECFRKVISLNPTNDNAYNNLGVVYKNIQMFDQAIECYQMVIKLSPNSHIAYLNLGNTYLNKQMKTEAIKCFKTAIELNPTFEDAYLNLGCSYFDQNQLNEAITCYKMAINLNPIHGSAYYNQGNTYIRKRMPNKSIACYQMAICLNPSSENALFNLKLAKQRI